MTEEEDIIVVKAGLVLAFLTPSGRLRLPRRDETAGMVIVNTAENGVVTASTGMPEGCSFVPVPRLQADLSDDESDALAEALLGSTGRKVA